MQSRQVQLIRAVAETVLEMWQETGSATPQGPMYAALMGSMSLQEFQAIMDILKGIGFVVTPETIRPGKRIQDSLAKSKDKELV